MYGGAHSLGALIAQYNAVQYDFDKTTTYAAPNAYGAFSDEIQTEIDKGKYDGKIKNVGHYDDVINNLTFFKPRIGSNIIVPPKYDGFLSRMPFIGQHFMGTYDDFDKEGNVKGMSDNDLKKYKEMRVKFHLGLPFAIEYRPIFAKEMITSFIKLLKEKLKLIKHQKRIKALNLQINH